MTVVLPRHRPADAQSTLAYLLKSSPYSSSRPREGVESLLAATAVTHNWGVFFLGDGIFHLLREQQPALIPQYAHSAALKLIALFEGEGECIVCATSLAERGLTTNDLEKTFPIQVLNAPSLRKQLEKYQTILTF